MYDAIITNCSRIYNVPEKLIRAIIQTESSWDYLAIRPEKDFWRRYLDSIKRIFFLTPSKSDDKWLNYPDLVSCSYGLMQLMLTTAMELGFNFNKYPTELLDPGVNIKYGCLLLKKLHERYSNWTDAVSSYNQGNNRKNPNGTYKNQQYVNKVMGYMENQ